MNGAIIASIKLVTGEEIICCLLDIVEEGRYTSVLIENPMLLSRVSSRRNGGNTYKISPWLIVDNSDRTYYELNIDKIIITTVVNDKKVLTPYKNYLNSKLIIKPEPYVRKLNSKPGYVGTVDEYRITLEHIYNMDSYERNN